MAFFLSVFPSDPIILGNDQPFFEGRKETPGTTPAHVGKSAEDEEKFRKNRELELKHGRICTSPSIRPKREKWVFFFSARRKRMRSWLEK